MMKSISKSAFYALLLLTTPALSQQSTGKPTNAAQKTIAPTHDQCANEQPYKLYTITNLLIEARQRKTETESLLKADPTLKAKQNSYEKALADAMNTYHQLGGTAGKLEDVAPMDDPCTSSTADPAKPGTHPDQSEGMRPALAMDSSLSMKKAPIKHAKHMVKHHGSRKNDDARECAELETNRAVIACAEKYR